MLNINKAQSIYIDFIRGFSSQMVLIGHLYGFYFLNQSIYIQNFGVVIFFILSGHLVTLSGIKLLAENNFNFRFFMIDRFSRIYSGLIPAILICLILDFVNLNITNHNEILFKIENLTFFTAIYSLLNIGGLPNPFEFGLIFEPIGSMRPLWSVALEWWIYIFFALTLLIFKNKFLSGFLFLLLSLIIIIIQISFKMADIAFFVVTAWLLSSCLVLVNINFFKSKVLSAIFTILFLIGLTKIDVIHFYEPILMIPLIGIYFSGLYIVQNVKFNKLFEKISKSLSSFSYSLYLTHYTIIVLLKPALKMSDMFEIILIFIICNIFALYFYRFFEIRYVKVRKFLKK